MAPPCAPLGKPPGRPQGPPAEGRRGMAGGGGGRRAAELVAGVESGSTASSPEPCACPHTPGPVTAGQQGAEEAARWECDPPGLPPGVWCGPTEAPGMGSGKALLLPTELAPASLVGSQRPRFTDEGSGTPGVVGRARANSTHRPALPASCVLLSGGLVPWASCCLCQWHSGPGWTRRGHSAFESVWSSGTEQLCAHLCPGSEQVA